jgi:hypothetical protein
MVAAWHYDEGEETVKQNERNEGFHHVSEMHKEFGSRIQFHHCSSEHHFVYALWVSFAHFTDNDGAQRNTYEVRLYDLEMVKNLDYLIPYGVERISLQLFERSTLGFSMSAQINQEHIELLTEIPYLFVPDRAASACSMHEGHPRSIRSRCMYGVMEHLGLNDQ